MKNEISVILVEDNREYRDVIDFALKNESGMKLGSDFRTAEIALRTLSEQSEEELSDVLLLDLNLPGMGGLEALPEFLRLSPQLRVIVLSNSDNEADVVAAIALGAQGYLLKSSTIDQILDGIRSVFSGGAWLDPQVAQYIMNQVITPPDASRRDELDEALSDRELEILKCLGEGMVKKEIGVALKISYFTVDAHVRNIYQKMKVTNAPEAINKAYKIRLFLPD